MVIGGCVAGPGEAADVPAPHVRVLSARLADAVRLMRQRSPTFAALLVRLESSDVIVHVLEQKGRCDGAVDSCLVIVGDRGGHRYLRIFIRSMQPYDAILREVAHELEHAAEIAARADARATRNVCDGAERRSSDRCETAEAQAFARRVMSELRGERGS